MDARGHDGNNNHNNNNNNHHPHGELRPRIPALPRAQQQRIMASVLQHPALIRALHRIDQDGPMPPRQRNRGRRNVNPPGAVEERRAAAGPPPEPAASNFVPPEYDEMRELIEAARILIALANANRDDNGDGNGVGNDRD